MNTTMNNTNTTTTTMNTTTHTMNNTTTTTTTINTGRHGALDETALNLMSRAEAVAILDLETSGDGDFTIRLSGSEPDGIVFSCIYQKQCVLNFRA
jgi:hypothetical protein